MGSHHVLDGPDARFLLAQPYGTPDPGDYDETRQAWPVEIELIETVPWYGYGTFGVIVRLLPEAAAR